METTKITKPLEKDNKIRNRFSFGLGTIGRDMVYSLVSMYLMFYYTDILNISGIPLMIIITFMVIYRVFDALNDPIMGTIVDNTHTKHGKFKPWIVLGALLSGVFTVLLFANFELGVGGTVAMFAVVYLLWGMSYTMNDISYWSMMPSLSSDQKERENIGTVARICANVGLFAVVAGIQPLTTMLGNVFGGIKNGYMVFAIIVVLIMWIGQSITVVGVKEPQLLHRTEHTTLKGMIKAIFKNDQLLVTAIAMALFMTGYMTTTSFGQYYFKYAYKNESMYSIFAIVLGVSQILALVLFPLFAKKFTRKQLYTTATILVIVGYIMFFFSPQNMIMIGLSGLLLFFGQSFIQLLMLVFLTDTVEYGDWKLGKRNESVSFSIQSFIYKVAGALGSGIVGITVIISGIDTATPDTVTDGGLLIMKIAMLIIPLILIVIGFIIYWFKYKIDKKMYDSILIDIAERDKNLAQEAVGDTGNSSNHSEKASDNNNSADTTNQNV